MKVSRAPRPLPPPGPNTLDPGTTPLPAPRLPLPEEFLHRGVPARPRGAPLHLCRLCGQHAVHAVRQRRPESEDGAADAMGGAGGAGVLGSELGDLQAPRTDFPSEPEHPARLLQPERGRTSSAHRPHGIIVGLVLLVVTGAVVAGAVIWRKKHSGSDSAQGCDVIFHQS